MLRSFIHVGTPVLWCLHCKYPSCTHLWWTSLSIVEQKVPLKDFHAEIRAFKDVEDFLSRTLLMLDLQKTGLTQIIEAMVRKLLEKKEVSAQTSLEEARHAIFTQDSGQNHPTDCRGQLLYNLYNSQLWWL